MSSLCLGFVFHADASFRLRASKIFRICMQRKNDCVALRHSLIAGSLSKCMQQRFSVKD